MLLRARLWLILGFPKTRGAFLGGSLSQGLQRFGVYIGVPLCSETTTYLLKFLFVLVRKFTINSEGPGAQGERYSVPNFAETSISAFKP